MKSSIVQIISIHHAKVENERDAMINNPIHGQYNYICLFKQDIVIYMSAVEDGFTSKVNASSLICNSNLEHIQSPRGWQAECHHCQVV